MKSESSPLEPDRQRSVGRFNRRGFLRIVGTGLLLAVVESCRGRAPEPTPTPTRTPRLTATPRHAAALPPTATNRPVVSPLATPTATVPPTETATAEMTATPEATALPSPTPTPTATPFPPGPPTKLGLFISRNDPRIRDLLATRNVAVIKTLEYDPNFAQELKERAPDAILIGRMDLPQIDLASMKDPEAEARSFVDKLLPIATESRRKATFDAWEAYNEPTASDAEQMQRLARFEAERTRLLAASGIRSVIGNFASGNPAIELWPHFRPAIEAAIKYNGYLGLHEYSAPTMQYGTSEYPANWGVNAALEGWLTLRYRKVYRGYLEPNGLVLPLLLTEVGVDGQVANRPGPSGKGWKDFAGFWQELGLGADAAGNYVEQLAWYDANLQQDKYVVGAAIFAAGASPGWESFEILEQVEPFLRQYIGVHPQR